MEQSAQIFSTSSEIIPPLILKNQCQNITEDEKQQIINQSQNTINSVNRLQEKLTSMNQTSRVLEAEAHTKYQLYYLNVIKNFI